MAGPPLGPPTGVPPGAPDPPPAAPGGLPQAGAVDPGAPGAGSVDPGSVDPGAVDPDAADPRATAQERLTSGSFSSGLTVPDFAACLQLGLRPVGLVQGFCVMQWGWQQMGGGGLGLAGIGGGMAGFGPGRGVFGGATGPSPYGGQVYSETWQCPHGFVSSDHRMWGANYENAYVERTWMEGFGGAYNRMLQEAADAGAHGVIGVVDSVRSLTDNHVLEFHIRGTAVVVVDWPGPPPAYLFTTALAGQRLTKLVEAGFMPVATVVAMTTVNMWASCVTEYLLEGSGLAMGYGAMAGDVEQVSRAGMAARDLAREHVRQQVGADSVQGAHLETGSYSMGGPDRIFQCVLRGNRVRRFKDFDPLPLPRPTVRLS